MLLNESNLPSKTKPYRVKEFEMVTFRPKQLSLMSKAVQLSSMEPVIEAMSQVLTGIDAKELTVGDFFYLLTIQRLTCFKRRPLYAEWNCSGAVFYAIGSHERYTPLEVHELATSWELADEEQRKTMEDPDEVSLEGALCGHANYEELGESDFRTIFLKAEQEMDADMDYPRVKHLEEFLQLQQDPELGLIIEACQYIKEGETLQDKVNLLMDGEDMDFYDRLNVATTQYVHGVSREVLKPCTSCGSRHSIIYTVDAQSFFL